MPLRVRFDNCRSSSRMFSCDISVTQTELFKHFTKANHNGFLEDVSIQIIDRVLGDSRLSEGCWQFSLHSFIPGGLKLRFVDP